MDSTYKNTGLTTFFIVESLLSLCFVIICDVALAYISITGDLSYLLWTVISLGCLTILVIINVVFAFAVSLHPFTSSSTRCFARCSASCCSSFCARRKKEKTKDLSVHSVSSSSIRDVNSIVEEESHENEEEKEEDSYISNSAEMAV